MAFSELLERLLHACCIMLTHDLILRSGALCSDWLSKVHLARVLGCVSPSGGLVLADRRWQICCLLVVESSLATSSSCYGRSRAILLVVCLWHIVCISLSSWVIVGGRDRNIMTIVEAARVVVNVPSLIGRGVVRLIDCIRIGLLQGHVVLLTRKSFRVGILAVGANVLVVLGSLIRVVRLLLQRGPALFTDQRIAILFVFLRVVFEKSR